MFRSEFLIALGLAFRARFLTVALAVTFVLIVVALLAAEFSGRGPAATSLDVAISFSRIFVPMASVLFVQELIQKEFDRRYCLISLTYPRSRVYWLIGRIASIFALAAGLLALIFVAEILVGLSVTARYAQETPVGVGLPLLAVNVFVLVDALAITAVAVLIAVSSNSPAFLLVGTLGFALASRSYSAVIELLERDPAFVANFADPDRYRTALNLLRFVLPDLGALDVRYAALFGRVGLIDGYSWLALCGVIGYLILLIAFSTWVLSRRDFA